jgi:methylenetetrahydrofolate reductase (NADPH)
MYTITVRRKSGRRKRAHVTTVRRACDHHMTFNRGAAMSILPFTHKTPAARGDVAGLLRGFSIEVMPRTAEKVPDFRALLPPGTRVYIAHIEGTPLDDMVRTARRIAGEGFPVMPHVPARLLRDRAEAGGLLARYSAEAGVTSALVLAGGARTPAGEFDSAMQLLETGLFDRHGFTRLHVAGHPEGNRDIDPDGSTRAVDEAVRWKQAFAERTGAKMALVTQFAFEAGAVTAWAERLEATGVDLPIHVGIAGPAKLQTLIRFAVACGVGPSLSVLQKRARDLTKLLMPYEPDQILAGLQQYLATRPASLIKGVHLFPLGGIAAAADFARRVEGAATASRPRAKGERT